MDDVCGRSPDRIRPPRHGNRPRFAHRQSEAPMSPVIRPTIIAVLGTLGVLAAATPAAAQHFYGPGMYGGFPGPGGGFTTRGFYPIPPSYFGGLPPVRPAMPLP